MAFAATEGIAGKSLREIALGADSSHPGPLAAIVASMEARQRAVMTAMAVPARTGREHRGPCAKP
jgi:hypothetical protein